MVLQQGCETFHFLLPPPVPVTESVHWTKDTALAAFDGVAALLGFASITGIGITV